MKLIIKIPFKPISVNQKFTIHARKKIMIKNSVVTNYERLVKACMMPIGGDIKKFKDFYDERLHAIHLKMVVYYPKSEFYTQKETINKARGDCSNQLKITEDAIFEYLGIDDSSVLSAMCNHFPHEGDKFVCFVELTLIDHPKVLELEHLAS